MWLSISYAESVGLYGPLNMTAKRKRLWIRSFNCYQLPIEFDRFSLADLLGFLLDEAQDNLLFVER